MAQLNTAWPDGSGFHFDLPPCDRTTQGVGDHYQVRESFYSPKYAYASAGPGYKSWGAWLDKIETDVRFLAISDSNSWLQHFPEVDSPWKFTEYTFRGRKEGTVTVEPELYSPKTLAMINIPSSGIVRSGKLDGTTLSYYTEMYEYYSPSSGKLYKQEELEAGIAYVDSNGASGRCEPWFDPLSPKDANGRYSNAKSFLRQGVYRRRLQYNYPSSNKGVKLYKSYVAVESTKMGQHGNVPPDTVNMAGPYDFFNASNMYTNKVVPRVTATFGTPVYAVTDGIIRYSGAYWGVARSYISKVATFEVIESSGIQKWKVGTLVKPPVLQPRPTSTDPSFLQKLEVVATGFTDGDYVHRGCAMFKGSEVSVHCTAQDNMSDYTLAKPNPLLCSLYPPTTVNTKGEITLYEGGPKKYYTDNGGTCPYYQHNGIREIALIEAEASTNSELMECLAGIKDYNDTGGASNLIDGQAMMAMSGTPLVSVAATGAIGLMMKYSQTTDMQGNSLLPNRQMGEKDVRWKVVYEFQKMPMFGRKVIATKFPSKSDWETYVRGTGRMAFDKMEDSYGGVNSHFFGDRNLLSISRFNTSVMPCYDSEKCNTAYGTTKMAKGFVRGKYAGVGGEDHCRYYNSGCPHMNVSRRAYEYDRNYVDLMSMVLKNFRMYGLNGFSELSEHLIAPGVYGAVGRPELYPIYEVPNYPAEGSSLYFYYTISTYDAKHAESMVFAHLMQYNHEGGPVYMKLKDTDKVSGFPSNLPWLVKLDDSYESPVDFAQFVTNEKPFMGGRHAEYKDMTGLGGEVLCTMGTGGSIYGNEGGNKSDLGGDTEHAATQDNGYYMGYRTMVEGRLLVDGRAIGGTVGAEPRTGIPPANVNGATPLLGVVGRSVITPDLSVTSQMVRAWVYSSDTRDLLASKEIQDICDEEGGPIPPPPVEIGGLPLERKYHKCAKCNYIQADADYLQGSVNANNVVYFKDPPLEQIITDTEYAAGQKTCPVCNGALGTATQWTHFPKVNAMGTVSVWALPGDTIRLDGLYWKNPTVINRGLIGQILKKLGATKTSGGGFQLAKGSSANDNTDNIGRYPKVGANYVKPGLTVAGDSSDTYVDSSSITGNKPVELSVEIASIDRLDGGTYADNAITPFTKGVDGLDMITINHLKWLRNKVEPMLGYEVGASFSADYYNTRQPGHTLRYGRPVNREIALQYGTLQPQIMAASEKGMDQYSQFWDGTLMPGTIIYNYWPTGTTWWRLNSVIGGIARSGGIDGKHLDNEKAPGYTGNVRSKAYFFLHGWVPLDKEIVKAYAIVTPSQEPNAPAIGRVWSGITKREHYHAFTTQHEGGFDSENDYFLDSEHGVKTCGASMPLLERYRSYMYNYETAFKGRVQSLSNYPDLGFGHSLPGSPITWGGYGTNMVQVKREEEIWKKDTFAEFRGMVERGTVPCRLVAGKDGIDEVSYDFTVFSENLLNVTLNNGIQPVPGYFDLSGMNKAMMYPKTGPVYAEKNANTAWAEEGQVVVQAEGSIPSADNIQWSTGGSGGASAGWVPRVIDITDVVKNRYEDRLDRVYSISTGMDFNGVKAANIQRRTASTGGDAMYEPNPEVNYRYMHATRGMWLNDPWHFPALEDNEMPLVDSGSLYDFNPSARLESFSGHYFVAGKTKEDPEYYDYHPRVLMQSDTAKPLAGAKPSTGGRWTKVGSDIIWNPESDVKYWYNLSQSKVQQNIVFNLRGFPKEETRMPYRHTKGRWNFANAICPYRTNGDTVGCRIADGGMTVSTVIQQQNIFGKKGSCLMPSLLGTKCVLCSTSLIPTPMNATGAVYEDGDGITTVSYSGIPDRDVFISAIKASPKTEMGIESDFAIDVMSSTSTKWTTLITVRFNKTSSKWTYSTYDASRKLVSAEHPDLPECFLGSFVNGGMIENATGDLTGKHFMIPRAAKVRYRTTPRSVEISCPSRAGAAYLESYVKDNSFTPADVKLIPDRWQGSKLQLADTSDFTDIIAEYEVLSNTESSVYCSSTIGTGGGTPPSQWRLISNQISVSSCQCMEVYGYETMPGDMTMTPDCDCIIHPLSTGNSTAMMTEFPSKIISVRTGSGDSVSMTLDETVTMDAAAIEDFYFDTETTDVAGAGISYQKVISGKYYFNPAGKTITVPSMWRNKSDKTKKGSLWTMNAEISPDIFSYDQAPGFVEIKYIKGLGVPVDVSATAIGTGPSYQVGKESVSNIAFNEPAEDGATPEIIKTYITKSKGSTTPNILPSMGKSVKLGRNYKNEKQDMSWSVYNHAPMKGKFSISRLSGSELGASEWNEDNLASLFGGSSQEYAGLEGGASSKIGGRVSGTLTMYGLPNTMLSGTIYAYAKKMTKREHVANGSETVVTYERTGGLKYTGFIVGVDIGQSSGRKGMCFGMPRVIVYAKERDSAEEIIMAK
jgi:hypothetical protein